MVKQLKSLVDEAVAFARYRKGGLGYVRVMAAIEYHNNEDLATKLYEKYKDDIHYYKLPKMTRMAISQKMDNLASAMMEDAKGWTIETEGILLIEWAKAYGCTKTYDVLERKGALLPALNDPRAAYIPRKEAKPAAAHAGAAKPPRPA